MWLHFTVRLELLDPGKSISMYVSSSSVAHLTLISCIAPWSDLPFYASTYPVPQPNQYTEFIFFYPTSQNYIPVCLNVCELFTVAEPLLQFVKVNACLDIALLTHICCIGRADLNEVHHHMSSHPVTTALMSI